MTEQVEVITSSSRMDEDNLEETFKEDTDKQLVVFGSENRPPNGDAPTVLSTTASKDSCELSHSPRVGGDRAILSNLTDRIKQKQSHEKSKPQLKV